MRDTGPTRQVRETVWQRDGGRCLRCRVEPGAQIHHRAPRGRGGTRLAWINQASNLCLVCTACHEHIERNRADAYRDGWLIKRTSGDRPDEVPLIDPFGQMYWLTNTGEVVSAVIV